MKRYFAEGLGTFAIVFVMAGSAIVNAETGGAVTHVGAALAAGLIVMSMIYAIGETSGAHINPAVTIAFWAARRFPGRDVGPYILFQCCGAVLASVTLRLLFLNQSETGSTKPFGSWEQAAVLELILTFFLMYVILCVSTGSKEKGMMAGVAIGGTVALEALFAGPITGASMNPARSLGPAVLANEYNTLGCYIIAPILGALLAVVACRCSEPAGCCGKQEDSEKKTN